MLNRRLFLTLILAVVLTAVAQSPVEIRENVSAPFRFVVYGDTRFTSSSDTQAANPEVRRALVQAIADTNPAFVAIGGDIAYNGNDANDWKVYDAETQIWRDRKIRVYPSLGNHDLHGDLKISLGNYFQRYPHLKESRYYTVRAGNMLLITLDSSLDLLSGPQGEWLKGELNAIPADVDFVSVAMHHPPYTSSSDDKKYGGGHSARPSEQAFARMLEERQKTTRARFVVFAGHVHNYERHEHGGVTYFVTGGGGAHAYPVERKPEDPFQDNRVNYHYLLAEVDGRKMTITMNRLEFIEGKPTWSAPDKVSISASKAK